MSDRNATSDLATSQEVVRAVVVVDDHRTIADLLRLAIDADPWLRCLGVAYDAVTAEDLVRAVRPDVLVCDLHLGESRADGLELTATLTARDPELVVLLLTGDVGDLRLDEVTASGASGLLAKNGDLRALLSAVRLGTRERLDVDPTLLRSLARSADPSSDLLSPRESDVLRLMARGLDVTRISSHLGIRPGTCRGYVKSLFLKLDSHSQLEAVARAHELGLLRGPGEVAVRSR